jgi:UDP-N-acetylglucosamine--N-acetylmuramyl-(pentapeptide) pyrophosphoryl-undecaprenol N-acetylglucosamine transferase
MQTNKKIKIIISGGGTGGHIFPAISIANALKAIDPDIDILFVGAKDRMEMEKVPAAGYPIIGLPIRGFKRKFSLKNAVVVFELLISLVKARRILKKYQPSAVVGVGGYASGPVLRVAADKGIPTLIQEQNSYAGVTNRLLAQKAKKICVAYSNMERFFPAEKIVFTGNPVRQDLENIERKRTEALEFFKLDPNLKTILILGGSLGARTINQSLLAHFGKITTSKVQLIWQTGSKYFDDIRKRVEKRDSSNIRVYNFISRMDLAYAAADLVISRAGAGTISELSLVGKPAILIPSPNVAEDHQTKNAMALIDQDAARMIKDSEAFERLTDVALFMISNETLLKSLSANISKLAMRSSARQIADEVLKLCTKENG